MFVLLIYQGGPLVSLFRSKGSVAVARSAAAPAPPAPPKAPVAPPPVAAAKAAGPLNLAQQPTGGGMFHLTWQPAPGGVEYRLYSASDASLRDASLEEEGPIPVAWYDWMPPEGPRTLWLAVTTVFAGGKESSFSRPLRIEVPAPATGPAAAVSPPSPPPAP
jgi:hypothetical protein